jgi:signal transduction histidine kinase
MESIKIIIIFVLLLLLLFTITYHIYYSLNIKHITGQLEEILNIKDTNQLLTVIAKQKDIVKLANILNNLIKDTRLSQIRIRKMNRNFRQSITNISHDLRTPLTTAGGYVQMLQSGVTREEEQEYLSIILERQNMVKRLMEQLFEYVRIESGEIIYDHVPVDAKKILVDTLAMYYDDFNNRGHEPKVLLLEKPCMIQGDEQGVKRIFSNILFNAILHGKGEYCFEIQELDSYVFIFSNISEPMSNEDLENIFERFFTADQSRHKKTTGLGLAIAKEIVYKLNGKIEAYYNNGIFSISVLLPKA